jgi:hypothetical protein
MDLNFQELFMRFFLEGKEIELRDIQGVTAQTSNPFGDALGIERCGKYTNFTLAQYPLHFRPSPRIHRGYPNPSNCTPQYTLDRQVP